MPQPLDYVDYLSKEIGARPAGTEEEQQAALYIADEFQKEAGFTANIEDFTSSSNLEGGRAILAMITIVVSILAMLFNILTIPALVLALEPNFDRIKGNFLENVIMTSIPGGVAMSLAVLAACAFGYLELGLSSSQVSTVCVLLSAIVGANLVLRISLPPTPLRVAPWIVVIGGVVGGVALFPHLFAIAPFTDTMWIALAIIGALSILVFNILFDVFMRWHAQRQAMLV